MKLTLREWQNTVKAPGDIIVQAVHPDGSDRPVPFPVGMHHSYVTCMDNLLKLKADGELGGVHEALVLLACNDTTDGGRRPEAPNRKSMVAALAGNGLLNIQLTPTNYFSLLTHYKFVISPEGRGIDCHRTYEALMAGCIPIVEDSVHARQIYDGCPVLYTKDYSELSAALLDTTYKEMMDKEWDFSRLFMSYYDTETQNKIKVYTNMGLHALAGYEDMYVVPAEAAAAVLEEVGKPWRYLMEMRPAPSDDQADPGRMPRPQTPPPQTL